MSKKVLYWAPCLHKVGTYYSTINSAISVQKYSKNNLKPIIINACGEWNDTEELLRKNNIEVIKFYKTNYFKYLPKNGFLASRFSYLIIIILSIFPLIKFLNKNKNEILIIHLITILPLFLKLFFNFKIKTILRISGYPKLNLFRKKIWEFSNSNLEFITCPTIDLSNQIKKIKIFDEKKIVFLPDAVLNIKNIYKDLKDENERNDIKKILAVGRLTKQKNFIYLLQEFEKFLKVKQNYRLTILGEGEKKNQLEKFIKEKKISEYVQLKGRVKNVFSYMKSSDLFVLSSLWEDPGFVIIEAAFCNLFIISSNCPNGPTEILDKGNAGILFNSNEKNALLNSLIKFDKMDKDLIFKKKILSKKNSLRYSIYRHFKILSKIIYESKI
jgi:glycosyltransferase involved in cell wall biosynthesis